MIKGYEVRIALLSANTFYSVAEFSNIGAAKIYAHKIPKGIQWRIYEIEESLIIVGD